MSADPYCGVCQGAGWDWRRAADEDRQVDDPLDHYQCPCVEVTRLRAAGDALAEALRAMTRLGAPPDMNEWVTWQLSVADPALNTYMGGPS